MTDDIYKGYTLLEKFDIMGQGITYFWDMFLHWLEIVTSPYDEIYTKCFFYYISGDYFYNAIAMEDTGYYLWKLSHWARNYPFDS